jgi:hypothetical protein
MGTNCEALYYADFYLAVANSLNEDYKMKL